MLEKECCDWQPLDLEGSNSKKESARECGKKVFHETAEKKNPPETVEKRIRQRPRKKNPPEAAKKKNPPKTVKIKNLPELKLKMMGWLQ